MPIFLTADKKKVNVDTPEFAEAMQWVADLALVEGVSPTGGGRCQRLVLPVGPTERWVWPGWDLGIKATFWDSVSFDWDIMPTPVSGQDRKGVSWLASAALCVSAESKEKQLAYELAEFLSMNKDAQRFNYESGQAVPNIVSMAKEEYLKMDKAPSNKQVFLDIIEDPTKGQFKSVLLYQKTPHGIPYFTSGRPVKYGQGK